MFSLDAEEQKKLNEWLFNVVYPPIVADQLENPDTRDLVFTDAETGRTYPYFGAIGGGLTYEFTPTSMGTVAKVTFAKGHPTLEKTIDLTDYMSW